MPYVAGQPWDKSLSYSYGQTCKYNGFTYTWHHPTESSSSGTPPNEDMKSFSGFDGTNTVYRSERGWVLNFGNIGDILKAVRNLPNAPASPMYEAPEGIKSLAAKVDSNPVTYAFYGWPAGMSVDYKSGQLYVGVYSGDRDNPYDPYFPRPDQKNQFLPDVFYVDEDVNGITLKAAWLAGVNDNIANGGADTNGNLIWFGRTYNFTLYVKWYDIDDNLISTVTSEGSLTSPSITDEWTEDDPTYSAEHTLARPTAAEYGVYGITHGTISPALDS